jgi:hypothetical protein
MAEHEDNKTKLHKEVSSIFKGVPIPKDDGVRQSSGAPTAGQIGCPAPKPPAPEAQNLQKARTPGPYQPQWSLQRSAAAQQPRAGVEKQDSDKGAVVKVVRESFWQQMKNRLFASEQSLGTTRQKAMVVLAPVLFIVMVLMLIKAFSVPSRTMAESEEVEPLNTTAASTRKIDWKIPAAYSTTHHDPMRPGSTATTKTDTEKLETGKTGRLTVRSIVYSQDNPSAVIGGRIVHEGEKVLGATVVKINRDSVDFEVSGKTWKQNVRE